MDGWMTEIYIPWTLLKLLMFVCMIVYSKIKIRKQRSQENLSMFVRLSALQMSFTVPPHFRSFGLCSSVSDYQFLNTNHQILKSSKDTFKVAVVHAYLPVRWRQTGRAVGRACWREPIAWQRPERKKHSWTSVIGQKVAQTSNGNTWGDYCTSSVKLGKSQQSGCLKLWLWGRHTNRLTEQSWQCDVNISVLLQLSVKFVSLHQFSAHFLSKFKFIFSLNTKLQRRET